MKVYLLIFVLNLISLHAYASQFAKAVYVSASQGNDVHSGLTFDNPIKHISKALTIGDTIYLKAGDIFFETVDFTGKYVTRYGKGKDPVICGFKHRLLSGFK